MVGTVTSLLTTESLWSDVEWPGKVDGTAVERFRIACSKKNMSFVKTVGKTPIEHTKPYTKTLVPNLPNPKPAV